jgi:hypothetical protein
MSGFKKEKLSGSRIRRQSDLNELLPADPEFQDMKARN